MSEQQTVLLYVAGVDDQGNVRMHMEEATPTPKGYKTVHGTPGPVFKSQRYLYNNKIGKDVFLSEEEAAQAKADELSGKAQKLRNKLGKTERKLIAIRGFLRRVRESR